MAEKTIGTDINQVEILSLSKIRGQKKVNDLLQVNLDAYFQSRQTGNPSTFGPVALIIHEFGHEYSGDHLSSEYHEALCEIGAKMALLDRDDSEFFYGRNGNEGSRSPGPNNVYE